MGGALLWGALVSGALLLGSAGALLLRIPRWLLALALAFGGGALISAVAFELSPDTYRHAGLTVLVPGLAAGALLFFAGDWLIDRRASRGRPEEAGLVILLGAALAGIPESVIVGIDLAEGGSVGVAFILAVFVSNLPEGFSGTIVMTNVGWTSRHVILTWVAVVLACASAALVGYELAHVASGRTTAFVESLAAGAVLVMLADTIMPEAFEAGRHRPWVGLATALGFGLSAAVSLMA